MTREERIKLAAWVEEFQWMIPLYHDPVINEATDSAAELVCNQIAAAIRRGEAPT